MENVSRADLLELLEELRLKANWGESNPTRDVLEKLIILLLDGWLVKP